MNPIRMSRVESAIRIGLKYNEAFNKNDVKALAELITVDCILESSGPAPAGAIYSGKSELTQFWEDFFKVHPGARIELEDISSLGFKCIMRWRYDFPENIGELANLRGIDILELKQGLICKIWSYVKG